MTGFIYAIADTHGRVKIGWSRNPVSRITKIRSDNAAECELLGAIRGSQEQERELHALLDPWRVRGEWFDMTAKAVSHFVSNVCPIKTRRKRSSEDLERMRKSGDASQLVEFAIAYFGSEVMLAKAAGVSQPVINKAKKTGRVGPRLAIGLDRATGGEVSKSALRPDLWPSEEGKQ